MMEISFWPTSKMSMRIFVFLVELLYCMSQSKFLPLGEHDTPKQILSDQNFDLVPPDWTEFHPTNGDTKFFGKIIRLLNEQ